MKPGTRQHIAGELYGVKGKVKKAAGHVTRIPELPTAGKVKSQARKTQRKARQAAEKFDGAAASRRIGFVATETLRRPANLVARIGAWSTGLLSSLLRMMERLFSYVGDGIRSISNVRLYKQPSPQAA